MRRVTKESLMKLKDKDFMHRHKAFPVPGLAPTRMYIKCRADEKRFEYLGKPSKYMYNGFKKIINDPAIHFTYEIIEFDRGGIISHMVNSNIISNIAKVNKVVWYSHHPDMLPNSTPTWIGYATKVHEHAYWTGPGWKAPKVPKEPKEIKRAVFRD